MEKLIMLYQKQAKILENLRIGIERLHENPNYYEALRESLIQRFEIAVEFFWKYLKYYSATELSLSVDMASPKNLIRSCAKLGVISEVESEQLLWMIDARNQTSHIYREEVAEELVHKIDPLYVLLQALHQRLRPSQTK